jgi:hypothetical protein
MTITFTGLEFADGTSSSASAPMEQITMGYTKAEWQY